MGSKGLKVRVDPLTHPKKEQLIGATKFDFLGG